MQADKETAAKDTARQAQKKRHIQTVKKNNVRNLYYYVLFVYRQLRHLLSSHKEVENLSNELLTYWEVCMQFMCTPIPRSSMHSCLFSFSFPSFSLSLPTPSKKESTGGKGWLPSSTLSVLTCREALQVVWIRPSRDAPPTTTHHFHLPPPISVSFH